MLFRHVEVLRFCMPHGTLKKKKKIKQIFLKEKDRGDFQSDGKRRARLTTELLSRWKEKDKNLQEGWGKKKNKTTKQTQWNWPKSSLRFFPKILQKNSIEFFRLTQYYCIRRPFSALSKSLRIICMCVCTGVQYMQRYTLTVSNNQMRQWPINFRKSRGECLDGWDGNVRKPLENF